MCARYFRGRELEPAGWPLPWRPLSSLFTGSCLPAALTAQATAPARHAQESTATPLLNAHTHALSLSFFSRQATVMIASGAVCARYFSGRELGFAVGLTETTHNLANWVGKVGRGVYVLACVCVCVRARAGPVCASWSSNGCLPRVASTGGRRCAWMCGLLGLACILCR